MEFIFQSGEFYGEQKSTIDALLAILTYCLSIVGAVWLFLAGIRQQKIKEDEKNQEIKIEKMLYFSSMSREVVNVVEHYIKSAKSFAGQLKDSPSAYPVFEQVPLNNLKRLVEKINLEEYYLSYISIIPKKSIKELAYDLVRVCEMLDLFLSTLGGLNSMYEQHRGVNDYNDRVKYRDLLLEIANDIVELIEKMEGDINRNDELLAIINNTYQTCHLFLRSNPSDIHGIKQVLITPLIDAFEPQLQNEDIRRLALKLSHASKILYNIKMDNIDLSERFYSHSDNLSGFLSDYNKLCNDLWQYSDGYKDFSSVKHTNGWRHIWEQIRPF